MKAVKQRKEKTQGFQAKKGLFSFLRRSPKAGSVSDKMAARDHIQMIRTPTPPPYSYNDSFPPYLRNIIHSGASSSADRSRYQATFSEVYSMKSEHVPIPLNTFADSSAHSSIVWPFASPAQSSMTGNRPMRPFEKRRLYTGSARSTLLEDTHSTTDLGESERRERERTLHTLTQMNQEEKSRGASFVIDDDLS
ncbi:MAG: hypothetical protein CYPHOPRED_000284 [Cyphobasidiales sp. Tagirdzhanova-0007]|nr:MAG: hypothetical protein CYPHOPRED_000284 [Cyphobasidiales sp. Tagirdzhanova-0007]